MSFTLPDPPPQSRRAQHHAARLAAYSEAGAPVMLRVRCPECTTAVAEIRRTSHGMLYVAEIPFHSAANLNPSHRHAPAKDLGVHLELLDHPAAIPTNLPASCSRHGALAIHADQARDAAAGYRRRARVQYTEAVHAP